MSSLIMTWVFLLGFCGRSFDPVRKLAILISPDSGPESELIMKFWSYKPKFGSGSLSFKIVNSLFLNSRYEVPRYDIQCEREACTLPKPNWEQLRTDVEYSCWESWSVKTEACHVSAPVKIVWNRLTRKTAENLLLQYLELHSLSLFYFPRHLLLQTLRNVPSHMRV